MPEGRFKLPLRIVVDDPVPGYVMALQCGVTAKAQLFPPSRVSTDAVVFDFEVSVDGVLADGRPRLMGPCVQGPPEARFVYICVHRQSGSPWSGRVKVPLMGVAWAELESLAPGQRLGARYNGTGRGGAPAVATIRLTSGWSAIEAIC